MRVAAPPKDTFPIANVGFWHFGDLPCSVEDDRLRSESGSRRIAHGRVNSLLEPHRAASLILERLVQGPLKLRRP
jgi:hypothetical protein